MKIKKHLYLPDLAAQSGYTHSPDLDFEYYNDDIKDFAPDSHFYICVAIK